MVDESTILSWELVYKINVMQLGGSAAILLPFILSLVSGLT
jgi:hypothetical protein